MYILYYLLSVGAIVMAMFADLSTRGVGFLVVMALVFLFLGSWNLLSSRVESQRRPERHMRGNGARKIFLDHGVQPLADMR